MPRPPLRALAALFARIPNLTFGGGDPTMAALERELVTRRGWLAPEQYGLAFGLARLTPGTNLLAFCAAAAWMLRGWVGAVLAVAAASAPAAIIVVVLTYGYQVLKGNALAMGAIAGLLASAVGMMAAAAWYLVRPHLRRGGWLRALVLAGGSAALLLGVAMSPVVVLALAAAAGFFWRRSEEG
jgi:chromate transporter